MLGNLLEYMLSEFMIRAHGCKVLLVLALLCSQLCQPVLLWTDHSHHKCLPAVTKHSYVGHHGAALQHAFHLAQAHILSLLQLHKVFLPVNDANGTISLHLTDVSSLEPSA